MTPEALEEVDRCRKAPQAVLAHRPPQQLPEADRFLPLRRGCRETVRDRLEQPLEPLRLDAPENLLPEHEIAQCPDCFDALTTSRAYRQAMPLSQAISIIAADAGSHFDREFVPAFLRIAPQLYNESHHS